MTTLEHLLRAAVLGLPLPQDFAVPAEEWRSVVPLALRQGVGALLHDLLPLLPRESQPPRHALFALAAAADRAERDYERKQQALASLTQLTGQEYPMVKGMRLAALYPVPAHRAFSDIDLYTGAATDALVSLLQSHGIACDGKNPRHPTFVLHGALFEAHRWLGYWGANDSLSRLASCESLEAQALLLAEGMSYDALFFNQPIPLRRLLDWLVLTRQPIFDRTAFRQLKVGAETELFADALDAYCLARFGLAAKDTPIFPPHHFHLMFCTPQKRGRHAVGRALRRAWKYTRFRQEYRQLYGEGMFRHFYWHNLVVGTRHLLLKRHARP